MRTSRLTCSGKSNSDERVIVYGVNLCPLSSRVSPTQSSRDAPAAWPRPPSPSLSLSLSLLHTHTPNTHPALPTTHPADTTHTALPTTRPALLVAPPPPPHPAHSMYTIFSSNPSPASTGGPARLRGSTCPCLPSTSDYPACNI